MKDDYGEFFHVIDMCKKAPIHWVKFYFYGLHRNDPLTANVGVVVCIRRKDRAATLQRLEELVKETVPNLKVVIELKQPGFCTPQQEEFSRGALMTATYNEWFYARVYKKLRRTFNCVLLKVFKQNR